MPINKCPFTYHQGKHRPILGVKIINPDTTEKPPLAAFKTKAIIDTGADTCAVPAALAPLFGYNVETGVPRKITTASGEAIAYNHKAIVEIYHPNTDALLYTVNLLIDFVQNLPIALLGVDHFLNKFVLTINYPERFFSINRLK